MTDTPIPEPVSRETAVKLDIDAYTRSLTGFDEIAIERFFGKGIGALSGTLQARALLFVEARRAATSDQEAFRASMQATIGDVEARFTWNDDDDDQAEQEEERGN